MEKETLFVTPDLYKDILKPNNIDLNNSFCTKDEKICNKNNLKYKRSNSVSNCLALSKIISKSYNKNIEEILLLNSGMACATVIVLSNQFNTIWYLPNTYPEMIEAYNINNNAKMLYDYTNISENDLVCIESCNLPYCNDNKQVIKKLVQICHSNNAYVLVDNTYYTSYLFNPFLFDVDIVIESLSKYNNGYNSSLLGSILIADSVKNKFSKIKNLSTVLGFYPHPLDCYLTTIGLQTLPIRLNQIKKTTEKICTYLLEENINFNAIIETGIIIIKSKKIDYSVLKKIKIFQIADTFGVNFSVITIFDKEKLYRLSIGLENSDDLISALSEIITELR